MTRQGIKQIHHGASAASGHPAPYADGYVEANGLRLHYLDYGTPGKPAMLCVHGGAAHGHWYDFAAPGFTATYHVRALDLRGHGDSQWADPPVYTFERYAADLAEVIEKLNLRDFALVGHSMGGSVCLTYASTYPGRIGKLVVIDSTMRMPPDRLAKIREVGSREGTGYATREAFLARYKLRPVGTLATPDIVRHLAENGGRQMEDGIWQHKFDRNLYARREWIDAVACWDHIRVPALLIKADRSERITPEILAETRKRCPHLEFAEIADSEHHIMLDNPAGYVDAVQAFLARHP